MKVIMKQCCKCADPRPISDFPKKKGTKDGHHHLCKKHASAANKIYMKKWRARKKLEVVAEKFCPVTSAWLTGTL